MGNKYQFNLFVFLLFFFMFSDWEGSTQSLAGDTGNYIINMSSLSTILVQLVRSFTVVYIIIKELGNSIDGLYISAVWSTI